MNMATKNPRVNVMLEPELYRDIGYYARKGRISLSKMVKELIVLALEDLEDRELSKICDQRAKTFRRKDALTLEQLEEKLFG